MQGIKSTPWKSGWTVEMPLEFKYDWSPARGAKWHKLDEHGTTYRDLGLMTASNGLLRGRQIRFGESAANVPDDWRSNDLNFDVLYVLRGSTKLETEAQDYALGAGTAITQPGPIDTPMLRGSIVKGALNETGARGRTTVGRLGTAAEIAAAALYFIADTGAFVTGQTIGVNGGEYI